MSASTDSQEQELSQGQELKSRVFAREKPEPPPKGFSPEQQKDVESRIRELLKKTKLDPTKLEQLFKQLVAHQHRKYFIPLCMPDGTSRDFCVHPKVMRPELMASRVLAEYLAANPDLYEDRVVIDMGCGSGIQGIVMGMYGAKKVIFVDDYDDPIANTNENVDKFGLRSTDKEKNAEVLKSDLFNELNANDHMADLIVFNHPFYGCEPLADIPVSRTMMASEALLARFLATARWFCRGPILMPFFPPAGTTNDPQRLAAKYGYMVKDVKPWRVEHMRDMLQDKAIKIYELWHDSAIVQKIDWASVLFSASGSEIENRFQKVFESLSVKFPHVRILSVYLGAQGVRIPSGVYLKGEADKAITAYYRVVSKPVLEEFDLTQHMLAAFREQRCTPFALSFEVADDPQPSITEKAIEAGSVQVADIIPTDLARVIRISYVRRAEEVVPPTEEAYSSGSLLKRFLDGLSDKERGSFYTRYLKMMGGFFRLPNINIRRIFLTPIVIGTHLRPIPVGSVLMYFDDSSADTLEEEALSALVWQVYRAARGLFSPIRVDQYVFEERRKSLRAAITAIMSRNMSHNIGSHVLSRMGRNRGELENVHFARYLEERMDFIAQVATEWPRWTEPVWVLQELLQHFLCQQSLLRYIASSEGMRDHVYGDNRNSNDIRLHVFVLGEERWNGPCRCLQERLDAIAGACPDRQDPTAHCVREPNHDAHKTCNHILLYTPASGPGIVRTDLDVQLAVPGGLVGYHAFYVILENVIRNAAKHGMGYARSDANTADGHLDVVIDILAKPVEWAVQARPKERQDEDTTTAYQVRVYDNVSRQSGDLQNFLEKRLREPLIDQYGALRKESWGLAEMRIAAGLLGGRSELEIGHPPTQLRDRDAIGSRMDQIADGKRRPALIRAVKSPLDTVGYEFFVLRPREVGICFPGLWPAEESAS